MSHGLDLCMEQAGGTQNNLCEITGKYGDNMVKHKALLLRPESDGFSYFLYHVFFAVVLQCFSVDFK